MKRHTWEEIKAGVQPNVTYFSGRDRWHYPLWEAQRPLGGLP